MLRYDTLKRYFRDLNEAVKFAKSKVYSLEKESINDYCSDSYVKSKVHFIRKSYEVTKTVHITGSEKSIDLSSIDPLSAVDDYNSVFTDIKTLGEFLCYMETTYFYQNDDDKNMWSIYYKSEGNLIVFFNIDDISVRIEYKKSYINVPDDPLKEFKQQNSNESEDYRIFVTIDITRNFGERKETHLSSILGSNLYCETDDENDMLDLLVYKLKKIMIETIHDMENHIIRNCNDIAINLTAKDFCNGTDIWRLKSTKQ